MAELAVPLRKETKDSLTPVAYELKLPPIIKCQNVFHAGLLITADFFSDDSLTAFSMHPHQYVLKAISLFSVDSIMVHKSHTAKCLGETRRYLI